MATKKRLHNLSNRDIVIAKMEIPEYIDQYTIGIGSATSNEVIRNMMSDEYVQSAISNNYQLGINGLGKINLSRQFFAVRKKDNDEIIVIDSKDKLFNNYHPIDKDQDVVVSFKEINWNNCSIDDKNYIMDMYHNCLANQMDVSSNHYTKRFIAVNKPNTDLLIPIDPQSEFFAGYQGNIPFIPDAKISCQPIEINNLTKDEGEKIFDLYHHYLHQFETDKVLTKKKASNSDNNIFRHLKKTYNQLKKEIERERSFYGIEDEYQSQTFNKSSECQPYIDEMIENNVVVGVYYAASQLNEIFMNEEVTYSNEDENKICTGYQAISVRDGDNLVIIQDENGMYEQYKSYSEKDNKEIIPVYKNIKWQEISKRDVFYIYDLYKKYHQHQNTLKGNQKIK